MPQPKKQATATKRSTKPKRPPAKRTTKSASTTTKRAAAKAPADDAAARLSGLRDALTKGVMLTGDRIQEVVDDAVKRGRMTRSDAEDLVQRLISLGRKQTEDLIGDIEQLLGRGASTGGDRVLRHVDKARRAVGIGTFPILGYDDLSAAQVTERLDALTPAQLRKVRDHEKRNANRKSVLQAIERKLK
jgi:polyhydroxyalkanoate synthesis regulator phasin